MTRSAFGGPFTPRGWKILSIHLKLSKRQGQIGRCLFQGMSGKQIAAKVGITRPTVRTHLERMFRKTDTGDRAEFVLYAMRQFCNEICHGQQ